jgi:hypothetical protein
MSDHKLSLRTVVRIDQSPMNAKQWCVQLSCGHEEWVTRAKRPKIKVMVCSKCTGESK